MANAIGKFLMYLLFSYGSNLRGDTEMELLNQRLLSNLEENVINCYNHYRRN